MWCSYSNVVIPKHAAPCYKTLVPPVSATSLPRRRRKDISISTNYQQVGESGVASLQSNTTPISKREKQEGEQISGSDILWALQRASDHKNMKMKKKRNKLEEQGKKGKSSSSMEETAVDYTNLRPLCINPNWAPKLDELEKHLSQLSDTI